MQRFGNLKVSSVFSFHQPETAFKKKNILILFLFFFENWNRSFLLCAHAHPSILHTALFPLVLKTTKQLKHIQTSYYVVVDTDTVLQQTKKVKTKYPLLQQPKKKFKSENRKSVGVKIKSVRFGFWHFGSVFRFKIEPVASLGLTFHLPP